MDATRTFVVFCLLGVSLLCCCTFGAQIRQISGARVPCYECHAGHPDPVTCLTQMVLCDDPRAHCQIARDSAEVHPRTGCTHNCHDPHLRECSHPTDVHCYVCCQDATCLMTAVHGHLTSTHNVTSVIPTATATVQPTTNGAVVSAPASTSHAQTGGTAASGAVRCVQCGDYDTRVACTDVELFNDAIATCQNATATRCMTDVITDSTAKVSIFKRCTYDEPCQRMWYDQTSDKPVCLNFDPTSSAIDLSCHFCCVGDGCNTNIVPAYNTQWRP